ncbi:methylated-DNA--[protein]-cysteine S-methyltransferase [Anaerocolumna xylanovorans]|uniref:methylated-DNA--[protein]-cysteine S-methyltransferase n=1 Tax=Anaerocolumna xylanovorans TaxID=100134 RepID=UPI002FE5E926
MRYAFYEFEFGILKIGYTDTAITFLKRTDRIDSCNELSALSDMAFKQVSEYLKGMRQAFDFPYELCGTEFQKKVWNALCQIPYGEKRTYKQIAEAVGNPKGSRAVGMANNKNPITIAVPCHRVIGTDGRLVGYAGGLEMKKFLLELEQSRKLV